MKTRRHATLLAAPIALTAALTASPGEAAAAGELECVPRVPTMIWTDSGSGATRDGSFWRPAALSLGDPAIGSHAHQGEVCGFVDAAPADGPPALRPAKAFIWRYDDTSTGAKRNVSVWEPVCPDEYVAMGMVASPFYMRELRCPANQPCAENQLMVEFERFRCVRADLVVDARSRPLSFVWDDKKSGGKFSATVWSRDAGDGQAVLANSRFFWLTAQRGQPAADAPTTARWAFKKGVVTTPQPVEAIDEVRYFNVRLRGTNLYVARAGGAIGEFFTLTTDPGDPGAHFHFKKVGDRFEIRSRVGGGAVFAGEKAGAAAIDESVQAHRSQLAPAIREPARSKEWQVVAGPGAREFRVVGSAGGAKVVWAAQRSNGARLVTAAEASARPDESVFEVFVATHVNAPESPSGSFDAGLGDDRLREGGIKVAAGLARAATASAGGIGGSVVDVLGLALFTPNPNEAIAEALERLFERIQLDIGRGVADQAVAQAGQALLDATFGLTVDYANTLKDNIGDPSRLLSVQNSAKDAARAFTTVRQLLAVQREGDRIVNNATNAFLIERGLDVLTMAAAAHASALQEVALVAAFDTQGSFDDEVKLLGDELAIWEREYRARVEALRTWRRDSVAPSASFSARVEPRGFKINRIVTATMSMAEQASPTVGKQSIGSFTFDVVGAANNGARGPVEQALRDRYRQEIDFASRARFDPDAFAAHLGAIRGATAELCKKVRAADSAERAAFLASALAGRGITTSQPGVGTLGTKSQPGVKTPAAKPPRLKLQQVTGFDGKKTWVIARG